MIGYTVKVSVDGVECSAVLKLPDLVAVEREYGIVADVIASPQGRAEWVYYLIWHAMKRTGQTQAEFEVWQAGVDSEYSVQRPAAKQVSGPLAGTPSPHT